MSASAEDGAALQQFCLLAKSAKGAGCASLIGQAIEHPGVFVFGELLDMPSVKEARANSTTRRSAAPYHRPTRPIHTRRPLASQLAGTAAAPHLELLKLFAWGTWTDYKGACPRPVPRRADPPLHVHVHEHEHERVHCVCTACARAAHHAAPGRSLHAARASLTRLSHAPLSRAPLTRFSLRRCRPGRAATRAVRGAGEQAQDALGGDPEHQVQADLVR